MNFLFSSLGKKIQIALSGFLLCFFLLFHLINNLTLIIGPQIFNPMVEALESIKPLIRIMEFGLLMILLMHIVNAITLTISNNKQKPSKYLVTPTKTSSINSRTMII